MSLPEPTTVTTPLGPPADGTADFPPAAPLPVADVPPAVPGYDILAELGRGGMGVVYHARHLALNRPVALKMVLAGAHAPADQLVRFLHEAELLARVRHPNVVAIYDVNRHAGLPYLALEYCPGGTLADKLAGTPLPALSAAHLAATLARAVQAAHDCGVIHRDLKPGNVLLDAAETPKLADFGLARFAELGRHLTLTGHVMGTPSYMAPEQAAGRSDVGPLADVYALGAMLYCFLTGRPPHQGATQHETIRQVREDVPAAPRSLVPGLPRDLETIALTALHKQPERRYATAAALAADLERWLAGEPIEARPESGGERAAKWARRRPTAAALSVSGAVALAVFVTLLSALKVTLYDHKAALDSRQVALDSQRAAINQLKAQVAIANEVADTKGAQDQKSRSEHALLKAQTYWTRGDTALARQALNQVAEPHRQWVWNYLTRHYDRGLAVASATDDTEDGVLSPDRQFRAVRNGNDVLISDLATGRPKLSLRGHMKDVWVVAWSPDGTRVATASGDFTVRVWDAATGREIALLRGHEGWVWAVAWSPDGTRVATASEDRTARVWDSTTGHGTVLKGHTDKVQSIRWSPAGTQVATASSDRTARVWDAATGREAAFFRGHESQVLSVAWSPDGTRVATTSDDGTVRVWAADGRDEAVVLCGHVGVAVVDWFPDGRRLRTIDEGHARTWDVAPGIPAVAKLWFDWDVSTPRSPDDNRRWARKSDQRSPDRKRRCDVNPWTARAVVIDESTESEGLTLTGHADHGTYVAWSVDSRRLATISADGTTVVLDGSPPGDATLGQIDRMWLALPRPEWHLANARRACDAAHMTAALFHVDRAAPSPAARWVHRGQYMATAMATARTGDPKGVPALLAATLRPPGGGLNTVRLRAALLDATNNPRAVAAYRCLARREARRLTLVPSPTETDYHTLAHLRRLAGDDARADAALAEAARVPLLVGDFASAFAAGAAAPQLQQSLTVRVLLSRRDFDAHAGAVSTANSLDGSVDPASVARLRAWQLARLADCDLTADRARAHLCHAIARARDGEAAAATAALAKADANLLDAPEDIPGNLLLRREALARIATIPAPAK